MRPKKRSTVLGCISEADCCCFQAKNGNESEHRGKNAIVVMERECGRFSLATIAAAIILFIFPNLEKSRERIFFNMESRALPVSKFQPQSRNEKSILSVDSHYQEIFEKLKRGRKSQF